MQHSFPISLYAAKNIYFPDPLDGRYPVPEDIINEEDWILLNDFRVKFKINILDNGNIRSVAQQIVVPAGFHSDLSSIPHWARSIIPVIGRQNMPSVIHDWLYVNRRQLEEIGYTREMVDDFFLECMIAAKVNKVRRNIMYRAVRIGGNKAWLDDK